MTDAAQDRPRPLLHRFWIYQRERFPLAAHGLSVVAFSVAAVNIGRTLSGPEMTVSWSAYAVACVVLFFQFFLLRVADEFKDAGTDARFRPERAVPRGLIGLEELRRLGAGAAALQIVSILFYDIRLLPLFGLIMLWYGLMSVEFFAGHWLRQRPSLYMISHMMIMPLMALFAVAAAAPGGAGLTHVLPAEVAWTFCGFSFAGGILLETGRKIRTKEQERPGVETYTALWGAHRAVAVWVLAACALAALALWAASLLGPTRPTGVAAVTGLAAALGLAGLRLIRPRPFMSSVFETFSGVWVLTLLTLLALSAS